MPALEIGGGFILTPMVEGFAKPFLPSMLTGNAFGRYAVKAGVVFGLSLLGGKFLGRSSGRNIAIGGGVNILTSLIAEFFPTLLGGSTGMSGYFNTGVTYRPTLPASTSMKGQAFLGMGEYMGQASKVVDRLDPNSRF
jgi:hypothetical protein